MASAIALAWCMSTVDKVNAISLIQTPRADLHLREENLYALSLAGIDTKEPQFLCVDDVPTSTPFPSRNFALVDHNRLAPQFTLENPEAKVVSVIDHHEDEGLYKETASPRTITVPTGSATSLVALYLREKSADGVPPELATLLLCGILIDTDGLKPGGKAEKKDREAAPFLVPRSLLPPAIEEKDLPDDPRINDLTSSLDAKKGDVSHLDTRDLLRRDYKEYTMIPSWAKDKTVLVGLASVPVGLKAWLTRDDGFFTATDKWMSDRGLSALGILTSFHDEKKLNKQGKPKHKREQIWVVRKGENELKDLNKTLFKGIKKSKELKPNEKSFKWDYGVRKGAGFDKTVKAKVYRQGVVRANRKVTAPVVKNIIEGSTS